MAKDPTVAPKERVNIVYRPAAGDAKEEVELPLKMLVMGDFTGRTDDRPLERREPITIDKDNFNEVLKAQGITLNFSVPNRLSGNADETMHLSLRIESMKDFGPEAIVEQVPELKRLLELREALRALKGPLSNVPEFRRKIQELLKDENASAKLLAEIGIEE
ncbi:MAG: type VI secretion system contractile sheath small subunit [Syntrophaceae bacterium]|nr:type VI secretion system contractile sheath small subunit [Syntrophaceae bacterium]